VPHSPRFHVQRVLFGLIATLSLANAAVADDDQRAPRVPLLPRYQQECAACHMAYPPGMLPAASWQRMANNLQRHYGTDASLDAATVKELSVWLTANAGTTKRAREEPPEDRITRSAWFIRKHNEVSTATWKLPAVKSAANCTACHIRSEQGDFNERNIRIPR
jgi:hypothetical protein